MSLWSLCCYASSREITTVGPFDLWAYGVKAPHCYFPHPLSVIELPNVVETFKARFSCLDITVSERRSPLATLAGCVIADR